MNQLDAIKELRSGGSIINNMLRRSDNTIVQGKNSSLTDKQIQAIIKKTGAKRTIGFDLTRTVKL